MNLRYFPIDLLTLNDLVYKAGGARVWKDRERTRLNEMETLKKLEEEIHNLPLVKGIIYCLDRKKAKPSIKVSASYSLGKTVRKIEWTPYNLKLPKKVRDFAELMEEEMGISYFEGYGNINDLRNTIEKENNPNRLVGNNLPTHE